MLVERSNVGVVKFAADKVTKTFWELTFSGVRVTIEDYEMAELAKRYLQAHNLHAVNSETLMAADIRGIG